MSSRWSPKLSVPRATRKRLAAAATAAAGHSGIARSQQLELAALSAEESCLGSLSDPSVAEMERPSSPDTLVEAFHGREMLGRGAPHRFRTLQAVAAVDADRAHFARHRMDCQRAKQEEDRAHAAAWRGFSDRRLQIHELKWLLSDPEKRQVFDLSRKFEVGELDRRERLVGGLLPTPAQQAPEDTPEPVKVASASADSRPVRFLLDSALRPRRPLHQRMKALQKNAAKYRREQHRGLLASLANGASGVGGLALVPGTKADGAEGTSVPGFVSSARSRPPVALAERLRESVRRSLKKSKSPAPEAEMGVEQQSAYRADPKDRDTHVLLEAFSTHDEDNSGSLDQAELVECLSCMGLRPKTAQEQKEIRYLIWGLDRLEFSFQEFSTEVVPSVRAKIAELRHERIGELWEEVDIYGKGVVSMTAVLSVLRRHGTFVQNEVCEESFRAFRIVRHRRRREIDESRWDESRSNSPSSASDGNLTPLPPGGWKRATLDAHDFHEFILTVEEQHERDLQVQFARTARLHGLTPEDAQLWTYDLVDLHTMFHEYDPCGGHYGSSTGVLDEAQVVTVLRESGYMPRHRQKQAHLSEWIQKALRADGTLGFTEFLSIIRRLRDMDRERLRRILDTRMPDRGGVSATSDVNDLLKDCGLAPRNAVERTEVWALVEDVLSAGSGGLLRQDVVVLCQRIAAKLRIMRHEHERQYLLSVGWTEHHYCEFRAAFQVFDEDMSEVLERDELMKAVELLKGHYWLSLQNINFMLLAVGIDPEKEIRVDFLTFMRLVKMLEDGEVRRQLGAAAGFNRERTDRLFSCFSSLEPENSNSTVRRETLARALTGATARLIPKAKIDEVHRSLSQEPVQVDFAGFLRSLKVVEALLPGDIEECISDMVSWQQARAQHESEEERKRPSLLRLIRDESSRNR